MSYQNRNFFFRLPRQLNMADALYQLFLVYSKKGVELMYGTPRHWRDDIMYGILDYRINNTSLNLTEDPNNQYYYITERTILRYALNHVLTVPDFKINFTYEDWSNMSRLRKQGVCVLTKECISSI